MAALWFEKVDMWFAPRDIERFKRVMGERMQEGGFTNVVNNAQEVAAGRGGGWTSLAHILRFSTRDREDFTFVIMTAADSLEVAKSNTSDVKLMLGWEDGRW
jgi:hypothetical protein